MAKESSGIVASVVGTVIGGIVLGFLTWIASFFPAVWEKVVALWALAWSLLTYSAPIPLSVVALAVVAAILAYRLGRRSSAERYSNPTASPAPTSSPAPELSVLERGVARVLAGADGRWVYLRNIADELRTSNLMAEQALEKLHERGFVKDTHNTVHGTAFRLTSEGRDFAIAQGYVAGWAQSA